MNPDPRPLVVSSSTWRPPSRRAHPDLHPIYQPLSRLFPSTATQHNQKRRTVEATATMDEAQEGSPTAATGCLFLLPDSPSCCPALLGQAGTPRCLAIGNVSRGCDMLNPPVPRPLVVSVCLWVIRRPSGNGNSGGPRQPCGHPSTAPAAFLTTCDAPYRTNSHEPRPSSRAHPLGSGAGKSAKTTQKNAKNYLRQNGKPSGRAPGMPTRARKSPRTGVPAGPGPATTTVGFGARPAMPGSPPS